MGQKAKNAGKKKSKVASNKTKIKTRGVVSLVGDSRHPPSKEWMEEVDMMLKENFSATAALENCKKGRACVRQTDLVKNAHIFKPDEGFENIWNSPRV
jgi:hypothetical protein